MTALQAGGRNMSLFYLREEFLLAGRSALAGGLSGWGTSCGRNGPGIATPDAEGVARLPLDFSRARSMSRIEPPDAEVAKSLDVPESDVREMEVRLSASEKSLDAPVGDHMTRSPVSVSPQLLATEALRVMNEGPRPIMLLFACSGGRLVGAVHMHDFLRAGVA